MGAWGAALCHAGLCPLECSRPCAQGPSLLHMTVFVGFSELCSTGHCASGSRDAWARRGARATQTGLAAWAACASRGATGEFNAYSGVGLWCRGLPKRFGQRFGCAANRWPHGPLVRGSQGPIGEAAPRPADMSQRLQSRPAQPGPAQPQGSSASAPHLVMLPRRSVAQ